MNLQVTQIFQTTQNASSVESPTEIGKVDKEPEPKKKCTCSKGQCRKMYCVCLRSAQECDKNVCQCKDCQNDDSEQAIKAREAQRKVLDKPFERKPCNCRKNYCKQNYCICHQSGMMCDPKLCCCEGCLNRPGAPEAPQAAP